MKARVPICLLAVATACLITAGCGKKSGIQYEDQYERAIGELFGEKVAATAPGGGTVVVLLRRSSDELGEKRNQAYLDGLASGLNADTYTIKEAGPNITTVKPQHQNMVMKALTKGWPARAVLSWCAVDKKAVAVVSFIEFPSGLRARSLSKLPPLFVCSVTSTQALRNLAAQGAIRTLIVPKDGADLEAEPARKASAEEVVALRYDIAP